MQTIKLIEISKSFKSKKALNEINIEFKGNKINGLLGPNGSGKTTLFNIIAGFLSPDIGEILLDDVSLNNFSLSKRTRLGISYLPQEASIFRGLSVEDNILAILEVIEPNIELRHRKLENLLAEFSIEHLRHHKGVSLSGGERRRVEIARALATDPSYLLLDEPFAGIDPIAVNDIRELVSMLKNRGVGVLITDHNVRETLGIIDRAIIVHDGHVLTDGKPEEIIRNDDVRRLYLGEGFEL